MMASEAELWAKVEPTATSALDFTTAFLGCRMGAANDQMLTSTARARLFAIVRAVSFVESRHGTTGVNQPARDPLQCGNPKDSWWKELTGQSGDGSRFVRGPGLTNLWARELCDAAEKDHTFPAAARRSFLSKLKNGHSDTAFAQAHSYVWGIPYLIHRINTSAYDNAYACGDLSRKRLIDGAVAYNGGGVPDYRQRIIDALDEFGDPLAGVMSPSLDRNEALRSAIIAAQGAGFPISRLHLTFGKGGEVTRANIDFAPRPVAMPASPSPLAAPPAAGDFSVGQRLPDQPEIDVCGAIEGRVVRGTPEFARLVEVTDASVVFKDEEGTGADRMMTPRLRDKLLALAALTATEWPGKKVRVTEAWDEDGEHAGASLHYEGRAADISVSDKDGAKLGRLAQLAVNAGFDWVFFEDSRHVHVSVKKA